MMWFKKRKERLVRPFPQTTGTAAFDRGSDTWAAIREHALKEIERLRLKNDGNLDAIATARVRGGIEALNELLRLEKFSARAEDESPSWFEET